MEELIKQIIEIEEKAQEVISDAKKADKELPKRVETDLVKLRDDIESKMRAKNASLKQMEEDDAEKKIGEINAETEKNLSALEEKYRQNKNKWIENIVSGVIGA